MTDLQLDPATTTPAVPWPRTAARWMPTFLGFPLGGLTAKLVVGPIDSTVTALLGGLITGLILGAVQLWGFGRRRPPAAAWIAATGVGLMVGLGLGATLVDFGTSGTDLALQGIISGVAVGAAQALVLGSRLGRLRLVFPPALGLIWAAGWTVTASIGVEVDQHFTVFGSSGALVVTALTVVLPIVVNRTAASAS